ncbi:J domain-containing protein [Vreelandella malpeensis]|uniref:J domain-containing protein n=1 Tax=Vreelandella malpeensis TaxID=1172368 RepID=A0ABS8DNC2_9GAMM|nr:J domain-containing protein [Halomonas malpeensis]MCB8887786.1 J domain-containing protein [Halomonas malpeensis]
MPTGGFSSFERVLIESRSQVDTAVLLLLAWVLVKRRGVSDSQRRRRLAQVTGHFRHGHAPTAMLEIAREQNIDALQLAAEVIRRDCDAQRRQAVMHQAITLATDDGTLSTENHHVLRFLADVLTLAPTTLATLFLELTGVALGRPEDISRQAYWLEHDADYREARAREEREANEREAREAKEREARQAAEAAAQERKRQEQARRDEVQREQAREDQARREKARRERARRDPGPTPAPSDAYKTRRALAVLGLASGASRADIRRAYRRLAQLNHPDRFYTQSDHHVALASQRFQRIKNAYDYLIKASL